MTEHAVAIAGGGPTGMMLAAELALAGVDVAIVERREDHGVVGSRGSGLHPRTVELLDQRGIADRFLAEARTFAAMPFGGASLDMSDLPTRHPYFVGILQDRTERLLADWLAELPVRIRYGSELTGFEQDDDGVELRLAGGETLRARYLVGCDGGRSLVRKVAGIEFPGIAATRSNLIAEVDLTEAPPAGVHHDEVGVHGIGPLPGGRFRAIVTERRIESGAEPSLAELRAALIAAFGRDFGVHSPTWISRFTDATRQAAAYRVGRVLLAGDAAHVHYPVGGQGLNLGLQDAVNLGWKLARVVAGTAPEALLDSYQAERHPVVARVLRHTLALAAMQRRDERMQALVELTSTLAAMDEPRRLLVGIGSGLDIRYDLGDGHPLLGRRMPDLDLEPAGAGATRVFELLHDARPLLLSLDADAALDVVAPWAERVVRVDGRCDGPWELPVIGAVTPPSALLVRPDGYVAWVGEGGGDAGLADALTRWLGPPTAA